MTNDLTGTSASEVATVGTDSMSRLLHMEDSDGNWLPPRTVTEPMRRQAFAILNDMPRRLQPASRESIAKWLASLGVICAGNMKVEDAQVKIAAYVTVLLGEFEAGCFTEGSLKRVYPKFQFGFPKGPELHAALKQEQRRLHVEQNRLRQLVDGVDRRRSPERVPPTPEQQARVEAAIREAGLSISAATGRRSKARALQMNMAKEETEAAAFFDGQQWPTEPGGEASQVSRETPVADDLSAPAKDADQDAAQ